MKENINLVELVMEKGQLCIVINKESAKDPKILTGIESVRFFEGDKDKAIRRYAPANANAYLGNKIIDPTSGLAIGAIKYILPVVYFHIDEEQAKNAPRPLSEKAHIESSHSCSYGSDGEAD